MTLQMLVTDKNLIVQGDPLTTWTQLDVTTKRNEPASGTLQIPATPEVLALLQPGARLVVMRDEDIWCAGPMEIPQEGDRDAVQGAGPLTVSFADDLAKIVGNLTYPSPLAAPSGAQGAYRTFSAVNTETIMRTLVSENCGPDARSERKIPRLVLGDVAGVGTAMTYQTRWEPLGDVLRTVAAHDNLGFRTRQVGNQIRFEVYGTPNKAGRVRISEDFGNLQSLHYKISAPTVTTAIVGGSGDGAARVIVAVTDAAAEAAWWRIESFVDAGDVANDSAGQLTAKGTEALAAGAGSVELSAVIVDTEDVKAGRDFGIGDRVSVKLPTGDAFTDVVTQIQLTATPKEGEKVTSTVGSSESTTDQQMIRLVRNLSRRLGRLETR